MTRPIAAIADELAEADRAHGVIPRITARYPDATVEDSYAIQGVWRDKNIAAGRRLVGRKIGLTSQGDAGRRPGITEPDYGVMFDDTVYESGADIPVDLFSNVRIEVELAFVLKEPLEGPDCTLDDALRAIDYAVPALEVLNSHIELEGRTIVDTIADNAAYGAMVLGATRKRPDEIDLRWVPGAALPQRRDRGDRRRRGRARPPRDRRRVAREQVPPARRAPRGRRDHPRRIVHAADVGRRAATRVLLRLRTDGRRSTCRFV